MDSPYSNQQGLMWVSDQTVAGWAALESTELQVEAFKEFVLSVDSPFEFWGMVFGNCGDNFVHLFPDHRSLILRIIVQNASRWNIDEAVCFLLEVIDDHPFLADKALSYLKLIRNIDIKNLEYADGILLGWLDQDYHDEVVNALYEADGWKLALEELVKRIGEANFSEAYKDSFIDTGIEILRKGEPVNVYKYAEILTEGYRFFHEGQYLDAIENLNEFYSACPNVFPANVSIQIARCFLQLGWNGEALQWIAIAQTIDPELKEARDLQETVSNPYSAYLDRIKLEFTHPHWTADSMRIFVSAEFLFRIHGRVLGDYGSIVSGYGRVVETQLRQRLLPKIRSWISDYGEHKQDKGAYCRDRSSELIYFDTPEYRFTLDLWTRLLNDADVYQVENNKTLKKGEFYYCAASFNNDISGNDDWINSLIEYGELIEQLKKYRNDAAHDAVNDWKAVEKSRELCLEIMKGVPVKDGNLIG